MKDASVFHWKWSLRQHRAPRNSFNSCKYLAPVDRLTEMNNESTMMMMPILISHAPHDSVLGGGGEYPSTPKRRFLFVDQ